MERQRKEAEEEETEPETVERGAQWEAVQAARRALVATSRVKGAAMSPSCTHSASERSVRSRRTGDEWHRAEDTVPGAEMEREGGEERGRRGMLAGGQWSGQYIREVIIENKLPARLLLLASIFLSFSLTSLRTGYHHLAVPATLSLLLYNYLR